jgi:surfactin synthase thioesterase subunit
VDPRWLAGQELSPSAEVRLFCLPYAGGGAAVYQRWRAAAPTRLQVCPVELPGRGMRLRETPYRRLDLLVEGLIDALGEALDRPYALFGHSLGGLVGFELAMALRDRGLRRPEHLIVAGTAAPGTPLGLPPVHEASDADLRARLVTLNGTPRELLDDAELMELMLPTVRADFAVLETYGYRERPPLAVPVTVLGGTGDRVVPPATLSGWRRHSTGTTRLRLFPGDHFFVHSAGSDVLALIVDTLLAAR